MLIKNLEEVIGQDLLIILLKDLNNKRRNLKHLNGEYKYIYNINDAMLLINKIIFKNDF